MKKYKKIAIIVAAVLLLCFCACTEKSEKQPYVIMVNALNGLPVYEQQAEAAQKAAEDYGVLLKITGPSLENTPAEAAAVLITKDNAADFEKMLLDNVRTKGKEW